MMPTNFNAVPNPREHGLDLATPPEGSVAPELVQQLMALPYDTSQVDNDYDAFIAYLNSFPRDFIRTTAQFALGLASSKADGFGPLSANTEITIYGLNITGKEFLARCWHFIEQGKFIGISDAESLARDRENARIGLIQNLADAYEDGEVVCNPGQLQHIAVGVLQGRLESVHIDREIPINEPKTTYDTPPTNKAINTSIRNTVASSLRDFLMQYESTVKSQVELKSHVDKWLEAPQGLNGDAYQQYLEDFRKELDEYLRFFEFPEETAISSKTRSEEHVEQHEEELVAEESVTKNKTSVTKEYKTATQNLRNKKNQDHLPPELKK